MRPDAVAVIGASAEDGKIGNSVMKNLINGGYQGRIYPIHPKLDEVMGHKAYRSVKDVPDDIDVAVFARSEEHTSELQSLMRISYAVFCLTRKKTSEDRE